MEEKDDGVRWMNYRSKKAHNSLSAMVGIHFTGGESAGAAKRVGGLASKKKPHKAFALRGINLATTYFPGRSQYHRPLRA